jgi:peptidoglycan/xylan/chitin deacetylase (PgdA/CDA1 family)
MLALTYDDGPNVPYTLQLMQTLAELDIRATFFLIGNFVAKHPQMALSLAKAGHAIGNHTYSHPDLTTLCSSQVRDELEKTQSAIKDATGSVPSLWRPPFGRRNRSAITVSQECGLKLVMWKAACYDWIAKSPEGIVDVLLPLIRGGEVIHLHDGDHRNQSADRSNCIKATRQVVQHLCGLGYQFVTVPEMMEGTERTGAVLQ